LQYLLQLQLQLQFAVAAAVTFLLSSPQGDLLLPFAVVCSPHQAKKRSGAPSIAHSAMGGECNTHPASFCFCLFSSPSPKNRHFDRKRRFCRWSGETRFSTQALLPPHNALLLVSHPTKKLMA
jgi:hypothetical protein